MAKIAAVLSGSRLAKGKAISWLKGTKARDGNIMCEEYEERKIPRS